MAGKYNCYSKGELLRVYKVRMKVFEGWIEPIMKEIGWECGKQQKFPPAKVKIIFEHLGLPD